jgi:DNA helicase-2/ATP-dependent DNA helicase PcrA
MRDFARWRDLAKCQPGRTGAHGAGRKRLYRRAAGRTQRRSAGRLENLSELARAMEEYETLGDFLEHVSLVMDNEANDSAEKSRS